ncbi:MAG: nitroreductase family protein, partial [Betaproteobacteria bacterium]|nr:nitroreductase family protein [Betaproteobacteria bacterium]
MHVHEAVERRHSVRAFRSDLVDAALLREILELAARAPSGGNLQP